MFFMLFKINHINYNLMDSVLTDTSNLKFRLNEFLESSLNALDKRSAWIHRELDRLREEYTTIIEKGISN